jgi:predicted RNA-binding protein
MCQSNVYSLQNDRQELLLAEAARLKIEGTELTIEPLVGAPISLAGRIKEIDLMKHRIVVEPI